MPFTTFPSQLSPQQREVISNFLILRWLKNADRDDLERLFVTTNGEMLDDMDDSDLIGVLEDNTTDEEFENFFKERIAF